MRLLFGFIMADTSRSRCYLMEMIRNQILPNQIIYLRSENNTKMLGQADHEHNHIVEKGWPEANFDPNENIESILKSYKLNYTVCSSNINTEEVARLMINSNLDLYVYSGYGGVIVKDIILNACKNILHVHGGLLPYYKGSTTNYFSILSESYIGATAIMLTKELDKGPIIASCKTSPPTNKVEMDHIYDSALRARVLVMALKKLKNLSINAKYLRNTDENTTLSNNYYYIIHPVLKHIAILSQQHEKDVPGTGC